MIARLRAWLTQRRINRAGSELDRLTKARRDSAIHQQWLRNHNAQAGAQNRKITTIMAHNQLVEVVRNHNAQRRT